MTSFAFISFSGVDKSRAEEVLSSAPKAYFRAYQYDFAEGQALLSAMKENIRDCSAFIFLASKSSIASVWCNFEIDLAELEKIKRGLKIYVLPVEENVRVRDLPAWMQDYWISQNSGRISVIQRRFLALVEGSIADHSYFGLEARVDHARKQILNHIATYKTAPNMVFFSGAEGIGRFTTARGLIKAQLNNERFAQGPIIELADPASLESLYIRLQEDFQGPLRGKYKVELDCFRALNIEERIEATVEVLDSISREDETIYIRCRSGFFGDKGTLIDWARKLLDACRSRPTIRLMIIANRQPRKSDLASNINVAHVHVHDLPDEDVRALVQTVTLAVAGEAVTPTQQALIAIGGHPMLARHYAAALASYGPTAESQAWYDTAFEQRNMLLEFLGYESLEVNERKILYVLSWFPRVSSRTLEYVCESLGIANYQECIENLVSNSLANYYGGNYSISGPVRLVFRQMYGIGDEDIIVQVSDILSGMIGDPKNLKSDTVETVAFLLNIGGKSIPSTLERIISPSAMLQTARELYRLGRDKPGNTEHERCVTLCDAALQITDEAPIKLELMMVQSRALMRMKQFEKADAVIKTLEREFTFHSGVIRAQYFRYKREYNSAIPIYSSVIQSGINDDAVIHEYCICLREVGQFERVRDVIEEYSRRVDKNVYLLDMKASLEIGAGKFRDAEQTISKMRKLPDRNETAARKEAILVCKETQNYPKAIDVIGEAIRHIPSDNRSALGDLYATRCVIYSKLGHADLARKDLVFVRSTHRQADFVAARLSIYIQLAEGRNLEALTAFEKLENKTRLDSSLRRDILARLSEDKSLLISERSSFREQYITSSLDRTSFTEFDF